MSKGILWLASYPRSGNTWIRLLLAHALGNPDSPIDLDNLPFGNIVCSRELVDDALGLESADLPEAKLRALWPIACRHIAQTRPDPLFVKSHARWPNDHAQRAALAQTTAGVVLIVRHPADVAVSLAHFFNLSLDRAIEIMADPDFCYNQPPGGMMEFLPEWSGSWSTHSLSWLDSEMPLHVVKYEDLRADTAAGLGGILSFAGLPVSPEAIRHAVRQTSLERLQAEEAKRGFREAPPSGHAFFRSGQVGRGQHALGQRQLTALTRAHGPAMVRAGYA